MTLSGGRRRTDSIASEANNLMDKPQPCARAVALTATLKCENIRGATTFTKKNHKTREPALPTSKQEEDRLRDAGLKRKHAQEASYLRYS